MLEDCVDQLHADFTEQSRAMVDLEEAITSHEAEVASQTELASKGKGNATAHKETTAKLASHRSDRVKLHMSIAATSDKLDESQQQLADRQAQLNTKHAPDGTSSRKK